MMSTEKAKKEILDKILCGDIKNSKELELAKTRVAKKYSLNKLFQNAEILDYARRVVRNKQKLKTLTRFLSIKPVRTSSGIASIAVMCLGKCPGKCEYCPTVRGIPKSYTGVEPATLRARHAGFDARKQVKTRLKQLKTIGHPTDKCEIIIMGGTFLYMDKSYKMNFVKSIYEALNDKYEKTLAAAIKDNEHATHRCVGLTIETRPDYCKPKHIKEMLSFGCTRVELGVQSLYDDVLRRIKRGHDVSETIRATRDLKNAGLKVAYHMMLGLPGSSPRKDLAMFKRLFTDEQFQPDELKIYPTLVIPGSALYEKWKAGEYKPLTIKEASELLIKIKQIVPRYVRIKRVMRDIAEQKVVAGPKTTNLRQIVQHEMRKRGVQCKCIRCREVGHRKTKPENISLQQIKYKASDASEIFLSFEDTKNDILIGFLRLRLAEKAFVRELHVYGQLVPIGEKEEKAYQHESYGRRLLEKAEEKAQERGYDEIFITSGVGVREYYRRFGYEQKGYYMWKKLENSKT